MPFGQAHSMSKRSAIVLPSKVSIPLIFVMVRSPKVPLFAKVYSALDRSILEMVSFSFSVTSLPSIVATTV